MAMVMLFCCFGNPRSGIHLLLATVSGAASADALACDALPESGASPERSTWQLRVSSVTPELPKTCDPVFAAIIERLATRPSAKLWITSVIDAADASSLNIATIAQTARLTEQALLARGVARWRVRLFDFRLPHRDRIDTEEIGRILIHVGETRPQATH